MKKVFKQKKGITLIALVITIIVLLILAGISISMLSGDNGILQKATEAKNRTERQSIVEQARTDVLGYQAENNGTDLYKSQLKLVLEKYFKNVPDLDDMQDTDILKTKLDTLTEYGNHNIEVKEIFDGNFKETTIEIVEGVLGEWETNEEGNTLTKYLGSSKNIVIPNKYNGKNITTIGSGIFSNSNIETIKISDGLEEILTGAFARCSNLNGTLVLPKGLKKIGTAAFAMNEGLVGDLVIPKSVTTIEPGAFASCKGLTKLKIEGNIESLNGNAFNACEFLSAELNMKTIPEGFFTSNYNSTNTLKMLILGNDVETIGDTAFAHINELETLVLGENIKIIGKESFYGCAKLNGNLSIPSNVTTIGDRAFYGCTSLSGNLTIPNSVTKIGTNAFTDCKFTGNLTISNNITDIMGGTFGGCNGFNGTLTIPDSVTRIEYGAFENCTGFDKIIIPNSVKTIGQNAFLGIDKSKIINNSSADGYPWGAN